MTWQKLKWIFSFTPNPLSMICDRNNTFKGFQQKHLPNPLTSPTSARHQVTFELELPYYSIPIAIEWVTSVTLVSQLYKLLNMAKASKLSNIWKNTPAYAFPPDAPATWIATNYFLILSNHYSTQAGFKPEI